ncbi:MAG: N-acetyltransferase family protein [Flavobacteriales bacterium]
MCAAMQKDYSHIREATADDLDSIQTIYNEAILNTTAIYEYAPFDSAYMNEWWNQRITHCWPVLVAEHDEKVVGFATYGTFRARTAYRTTCEHSVYVLENYRGKGLGKTLLQSIVKAARANGVHVLIGGIDADNQLSIVLHESEGFRIAGHLHEVAFKFDRWLDLVFMEKKL